MADTSTERARRSRAHARGDHSLCRAQRCGVARAHEKGEHSRCSGSWCEAAAKASLAAGSAPPPSAGDGYRVRSSLIDGDGEFGPEGQELWDAVNPNGDLKPLQAALLREACRITDRLGALDRHLKGDGPWLELSTEDGVVWHVDVTDVLKEARSQAGAFRGLVTELRQSSSTSRAFAPPAPDAPEGEGGASVVDLGAAIRARFAAAQTEG
ncbi:hypothetical protein SAMN04489727_1716 [Amycolatopsis tolypomycina]|uniref:Uncharacterized protein n=1 Tax=Amycolatopsis tolypomycina TaxID=208445 RepID=A0A1H4JAY9_9PSEU|nr:hypothetical protein [Amycolatopsis tolypomycina]SEB43470.1 hypothetical protein SAMN04489727_1716 [Amycolatopsis tolypomycina]